MSISKTFIMQKDVTRYATCISSKVEHFDQEPSYNVIFAMQSISRKYWTKDIAVATKIWAVSLHTQLHTHLSVNFFRL